MGTLHFTSHICEKMQDKQQFYSFQTLQQLTQGVPKICFLSRTIEDPAFLHSNLPPPIWWTDKVTWFSILCQPRTNTPCVAQPWNHSYFADQDTKILKRCVRRDEMMKGGDAFLKEAQFLGSGPGPPPPMTPLPPHGSLAQFVSSLHVCTDLPTTLRFIRPSCDSFLLSRSARCFPAN